MKRSPLLALCLVTRRHSRQLLAATLGLCLLAGCSAATEHLGQCVADGDCGPDAACNGSTGQCLPHVSKNPSLEVVPPAGNNQGWVVQEFLKGTLGPDGRVDVKLEASVSLEGHVYSSELDEQGQRVLVAARIIAWRDSLIAGRPRVQLETTTPGPGKRSNNQKDSYLLWLNRGFTYMVLISPEDSAAQAFPPLVAELRVDDHLKQDFILDGKDRAVEVTGIVVDASGAPLSFPVRVRAYRASGLQQSTLGVAAPKTGAFSFRVPAGVASYTVRVESAPGGTAIPTMECTNRTLGLLSPSPPGESPKQSIDKVRLPAFRTPATFEVNIKGKDDTAVSGATVSFSLPFTAPSNTGFDACTASYAQTTVTNAEGKATLSLIPADDGGKSRRYVVTVVSPPASPFASKWVQELEVGAKGGFLGDIMLEPRYKLTGRVLQGGGLLISVAGATVEAQGIASGGAAGQRPPGNAVCVTSKQGKFELYVDPGIYNIDVRPPPDLGLPSFGLTAKSITGDATGLDLEVPPATILSGRILDAQGREMKSAQVQVYDLVPEREKPILLKATLRSQSVTDTRGAFNLLLPPSVDVN